MDEKEKELSQENFLEVVGGAGGEPNEDLLTDPSAVAASNDTDNSEGKVSPGDKLKSMREKKGLSTNELAMATGIDVDLIEQVEAGSALLPLGLLIKIGAALSLRIRDVIGSGNDQYTVVRAAQRPASQRFGEGKKSSHGYEFESLAASKGNRKMEPFVVNLTQTPSNVNSSHEGQEFIYILEGEVELTLGEETEVLKPGDSAYYESTIPHRVRAHNGETAKLLAVLTD